MTNALDTIRRYLSAGDDVVLASSLPTVDSHLSKRSIVHLQKRLDWCTDYTYCEDGYHCIGGGLCHKNLSPVWIVVIVFIVFLFFLTIFICIRRRRAAAAMASQPAVETIAVIPQSQYSAYPLPQNYAPPPPQNYVPPPPQNYGPPGGDPNMAYQTPAVYVPPAFSPAPVGYAAPGAYGPPAGSPYPEKPYDAPPAAYSPYPPAGGPTCSAPYSPAPYSAAAAPATGQPQLVAPAAAYSAPNTHPSTGQPQLIAPASYPVPQGEASSYAPPK